MYDQITCTDELHETLAEYEREGLPAPVDAQMLMNSGAFLAYSEEPDFGFITESFVMETE